MMKSILPPICLLLALALAITGFAVIAFGSPEETVSLYQARADGDERATTTLEDDLQHRQTSQTLMIAGLFVSSAVMTVTAFTSMSGPKK